MSQPIATRHPSRIHSATQAHPQAAPAFTAFWPALVVGVLAAGHAGLCAAQVTVVNGVVVQSQTQTPSISTLGMGGSAINQATQAAMIPVIPVIMGATGAVNAAAGNFGTQLGLGVVNAIGGSTAQGQGASANTAPANTDHLAAVQRGDMSSYGAMLQQQLQRQGVVPVNGSNGSQSFQQGQALPSPEMASGGALNNAAPRAPSVPRVPPYVTRSSVLDFHKPSSEEDQGMPSSSQRYMQFLMGSSIGLYRTPHDADKGKAP